MSDGKEIGNVVAAGEQAVADVLPSLKDGFQPKDLVEIGGKLIQHLDVYLDAIKGAGDIPAEIKNMKKTDMMRIVGQSLIKLADSIDAQSEPVQS